MIRKIKNIIQTVLGLHERREDSMLIEKDFISKYLPPAPVIIDCGAHIGIDSVELAKIPGSKIYAFEPVKEIFQQLVSNTKDFQNITCFNVALNDFDGEAEMFVSSGDSDGSSSLMRPKDHIRDHPGVLFNEIQIVKCQKLDSWANENNITKVDMLWLDMQGAEQKMLSVSTSILNTISVIHSEVSVRETYEGVKDHKAYKKFLRKKGFSVKVQAIPKSYDMGNILFVRN